MQFSHLHFYNSLTVMFWFDFALAQNSMRAYSLQMAPEDGRN